MDDTDKNLLEHRELDELIEQRKKGVLKIYLGYAAGVGKTFAMLQEAQRLIARGVDVVIGYLEAHDRQDTTHQSKGLEMIPRLELKVGGKTFSELDVKACLERAPSILLVDELAHTNAEGSKNSKRYQDVVEVLDAGINVISTLNIQHLESVADKVTQVSGAPVYERVPDWVIQRADQIVNIDVTIADLRERIRQGKIYEKNKAENALVNFFTHHNLSFLREASLREAAEDQIRKIGDENTLLRRVAATSQDTVMVALSSDPTSAAGLIRKGIRLALQLASRCYVVYVQSSKESPTRIDSALQRKLQNNLNFAQEMGAEVAIIQTQDVAEGLVNFAHEHFVTHAVFGKSRLSPLRERLKGSVLAHFIHDSVGIDVHIVCTNVGGKE